MAHISADQLAERLEQKANLLRIEAEGNTVVWFSTKLPRELPAGSDAHIVSVAEVPLPHNHYRVTTRPIEGWMAFWRHLGPRCQAAAAFVTINPLNSKSPIVGFESFASPPDLMQPEKAQWQFGFESEAYLSYFCKGATDGLSVPYGHPLADVRIRILAVLSHKIDSSAKAFESLGRWLIEALYFEMYKRDWLQAP